MPSVSKKQRKFFGWLEHAPEAAAKRKEVGMTHQEMHDYASTPEKGLPMRKRKK
jgi:hypothetical protein